MNTQILTQTRVFPGVDPYIMMRIKIVRQVLGVNTLDIVQQSDLNSLNYHVYDVKSNNAEIANGSVSIPNCVFNTLQPGGQGQLWDLDSIGYNFLFQLPRACLPDGNGIFRVLFPFVLTGNTRFIAGVDLPTLNVPNPP